MLIRRISLLLLIVVMATFGSTAATSASNHGQGRAGDAVPDSYIISLVDGASVDDVAAAHSITKGHVFNAVFNGFSATVPPGLLKQLQNDPNVAAVNPNRIVSIDAKPEKPGGGGKGKNKAPTVEITAPTPGTFGSGASISFAGNASDPEDGDLTTSLAWTSDIDGSIGSGGSFSAVLNDGSHTVTASVTDTGGKQGSASISITVGDVPEPSNQVVPSGVARIGAAPGNLTETGQGVGVAIIDTGLDYAHSDIDPGIECFGVTAYGTCQDGHGHGTHVGGTVAALDNLSDVVGVAPDATLYGVKVLADDGYGDDAIVIAGLDWVAANAGLVDPNIRVANMSLGRPASSNPADDEPMRAAIQAVVAAGVTVVTSAGNDASVEAIDKVPAGFPEVISVASVTAEDGKGSRCGQIFADTASYFTTDGSTITISAPGENKEDVKGCQIRGVGILSLNVGGGTTRKSGTSMASPHVAGVAARCGSRQASGLWRPQMSRVV